MQTAMVITRSCVVGALAIGLFACGKDDAATKTEAKTETKPAPAPEKPADTPPAAPTPPPAPPAPVLSDPAKNPDLPILPVDSEIVAGINVSQVQQSGLWKQYALPFIQSQTPLLKSIKTSCGFDPLQTVTSISVGIKNLTTQPDIVAVVHGLDKAKMLGPCLAKIKAELAKEKTKVAVDNGVVTMVGTGPGEQLAYTFTDDHTLVGAFGTNGTKAGVMALAQGGSTLPQSTGFVDMYSKIDTSLSAWGLANGNSHVFDKLAALVKPQAVYGSLDFTDSIGLDVRMRVDKEDQARQLVGMGTSQQAATKQYFDKFVVTQEGNDVHVVVGVTAAQLKAIRDQFGGMLGLP